MRKFLKEYRIEIIVVLLALTGVFLLVEQLDIRVTLREAFQKFVEQLRYQADVIPTRLAKFISDVTLSDFIGWILLILAGIFILWRIRYRFYHSKRWRISQCPRCGSSVHHVHRSQFDRIVTFLFLPHFHRYRCSNSECGWSGLRRRRRGSDRHLITEDFPQDYIPE